MKSPASEMPPIPQFSVIRMNIPISKYRSLAEIHSSIDYGDKGSVKAGNQAADKLRFLAEKELKKSELLQLLEVDHPASNWAAHHVLEFKEITKKEEKNAIAIIERQIEKGGAQAMGERMWLDEYKSNKK